MKTMSNIIGLRNFREETDKYIKEVKKGKSFTVLKKNNPVFKIVPADVWGDDGIWETVISFKDVSKNGSVDSLKVLNALWSLK
ncbi:MAG: type II toxin-antitoxin system prevent-host-death family antitoxin [Candidatus Nomurabacteria bacterium]